MPTLNPILSTFRFPDQPSAADVVNYVDEKSLIRILKKYGEEKQAQLVAHAIIDSRYAFGRITSTAQLADIVATAFPSPYVIDKIGRKAHVATRTFQALRIFVNNELNEVNNGLEICHHLLSVGGRCVVLSFHSLEDRIAKRHFHGIDMNERLNQSLTDKLRGPEVMKYSQDFIEKITEKCWQPMSRKISTPSQEEVANNPRSRSAKMRVAVKLK
ncbi:hypothetical protein CAPTEDRAFT_90607 [Capitella teleta]|uniref:Uncharacterized protein n=1 Tax=Capitella teleta TaxID=283909 RepID=R7T9V5_CAPTE|nr:hypothetical protein CAPTEDRAFT_90607 [Capitella teleta]|eukprot:ELT90489.1 hypothetical protein CAPTEDRAFT_90607 [Capitella teleta]